MSNTTTTTAAAVMILLLVLEKSSSRLFTPAELRLASKIEATIGQLYHYYHYFYFLANEKIRDFAKLDSFCLIIMTIITTILKPLHNK